MSRALSAALCLLLILPFGTASPVLAEDLIATTTTITSIASPIHHGGSAWVNVLIEPVDSILEPNSGTVWLHVFDESNALVHTTGATVAGGSASAGIPTSDIAVGSYTVTAEFLGNASFAGSTSAAVGLEVTKIPRALALAGGPTIGSALVPAGGIHLAADVDFGMEGYSISFYETTDGAHTLLGSDTADGGFYPYTHPRASIDVAGRDAGTYSFSAEWPGNATETSAEDSVTLTVSRAATSMTLYLEPASIEENHPTTLTWAINRPASGFEATGTVTVRDETTDTVLASGDPWGQTSVSRGTSGSHVLTATYDGDEHYLGSAVSKTLLVTPDLAHARDVGVQYTTFYPVVDAYRDTDRLSGTRSEPLSVQISIYNSSGTRVRNASIARGSGSYSWTWKGKSNAGHLVAAGKYKVVQKLTDSHANSLSVTKYVTVSQKTIHYSTVTLNKLGNHPTATGHAGVGKVRLLSDGSAQLDGSSGGKAGWAAVGYQFSLPAAAVYKNMKVAVYASTFGSTLGQPKLRAQDFSRCAYKASTDWDDSCFDTLKHVALSTTWTSAPVATKYRHNHVVRAAVTTVASTTVWKVRFTVTIGVLK